MKADVANNSAAVLNPWYKAAIWTAVVAGVFSVIVAAQLGYNWYDVEIADANRALELEDMKLEFGARPNDEQLLSEIRQLDLEIRENRIRWQELLVKGAYLLLGGGVLFFVCIKWAMVLGKRPPFPRPSGDVSLAQQFEARRGRRSVIAGLVVVFVLVVVFRFWPVTDFGDSDSAVSAYPSAQEIKANWPRFRGPGGLGIAAYTNVPKKWDVVTGEGIVWKSKVPRAGHNSPVVWGDKVFLSGGDESKLEVYCFDAVSGKMLWRRTVVDFKAKGIKPRIEEDTGIAAPTCVTDGRRVYAIFATGDICSYDFKGKQVWAKKLGLPDSVYGYATSLAMYRNLVLIQYDQGMAEDKKSMLIALDSFSGNIVWQKKRPVAGSWTSPIVADVAGQAQFITCGDPWVIAYEPAKGTELWRVKCLGTDVAPSPIYANGLVFAIKPYSKLVAIKAGGSGDVTKTHIAWEAYDGIPDICSPVSDGRLVYLLDMGGLITCYDIKDGAKVWEKDIKKSFQASPSIVGDKVYLLSEKGVMYIIEAGREYKEVAVNELGENCYASPGFMDGRIYIRGVENLYCIGKSD